MESLFAVFSIFFNGWNENIYKKVDFSLGNILVFTHWFSLPILVPHFYSFSMTHHWPYRCWSRPPKGHSAGLLVSYVINLKGGLGICSLIYRLIHKIFTIWLRRTCPLSGSLFDMTNEKNHYLIQFVCQIQNMPALYKNCKAI